MTFGRKDVPGASRNSATTLGGSWRRPAAPAIADTAPQTIGAESRRNFSKHLKRFAFGMKRLAGATQVKPAISDRDFLSASAMAGRLSSVQPPEFSSRWPVKS